DGTGNFVVVWSGGVIGDEDVFAQRYGSDGQPLGEEIWVSADAFGGDVVPAVAMDPAGNFVVSWARSAPAADESGIFARSFAAGGEPLGDEFAVGSLFGGSKIGLYPALARDATGDFLILWRVSFGAYDDGLFGRHYAADAGPQGGPFRLDAEVSGTKRETAAAVLADGSFVAVYSQRLAERYDYHVFGRLLPPEARAGTVHLAPVTAYAAEGDDAATVTVLRTGGSSGVVSVDYLTADGTATAGEDYLSIAGTLSFADGDWQPQEIEVPILDDDLEEGTEGFTLELADPLGGASLIAPSLAEVTVFDDEVATPGQGPVPTGPPFRVADESGGRRQPAVATAANGDCFAVWKSSNEQGQQQGVVGRFFDAAGVARGPAFPITAEEVDNPAVAVDAGANFLVVWEAPYSLRGRWFHREGEALGEAFTIAEELTGLPRSSIRFPKAAGLSSGNAVVVWSETFRGFGLIGSSVHAQRVSSSGALIGELFTVAHRLNEPTDPVAAVAGGPADDFVVTWNSEHDLVFAQRYDPDAVARSAPLQVHPFGSRPAIAMDAAGGFTIVWEQEDAGAFRYDVFGRRYAADGSPLDAPFPVNTSTVEDQRRPAVATDATGNFTVVWESHAQDGSGNGVYGQRFDALGEKVGGEFRVNTATANDQQRPAVASDAAGDLVVAWETRRPGSWDVLARRYVPTGCEPTATTLCLGEGRFALTVAWEDFAGATGQGRAGRLTADTGTFWFFDDFNIELVVKILDGTVLNDHYWLFYGALSNVAYTLTVTDAVTGFTREYVNPAGRFASVGDVEALPVGGGGSAVAASPATDELFSAFIAELRAVAGAPEKGVVVPSKACTGGATSLCLQDERFRIEVDWRDFEGHTGSGQAVPLTPDTGYFWFFDDTNVELIIKVLDGTAINGRYWVFYGALSNVEYTITVTDTVTQATKVYTNPLGRFASVGDIRAFPDE
ncbi:MAG: hypothetical protein GY856_18290, partial [bacterium]|nr:hypothetical protein [bacterium]